MKSEDVEFTIKCKMKARWVPHFCSMLKYMEQLGDLGSSRKISFYSDGDGDFRPKFNMSVPFKRVPPVMGQDSGAHYYDAG